MDLFKKAILILFISSCNVYAQEISQDFLIDVVNIGKDTLNYIPTENAKIVSIVGGNYTISKEYTPNFFTLNKSKDVSELNIYGKVIRISSPIHFPHSRIKIYCDSLIFEKNNNSGNYGSINNTPLKHFQSRALQFKEGLKGLDAKPILISARAILKSFIDKPNEQIIANGGEGQDAGYGRDGKQGKSYPVIRCRCSGCEGSASTAQARRRIYKNLVYENGCPSDQPKGTRAWPEDGEDAIPGGKPGEGGNGGDLYINNLNTFFAKYTNTETSFRSMYSVSPGMPGDIAKETPYKGGPPGQPELARWWVRTGSGWSSTVKQHLSKKGKNIENPKPIYSAKRGGYHNFADDDITDTREYKTTFWVHPEFIRFEYLKLIDLIKKKDYSKFKERISQLDVIIKDHEKLIEPIFTRIPKFWDISYLNDDFERGKLFTYLTKREFNDLKSLILKIKKLKHNYNIGLDFYGKPFNWAPMLSFEYNYAIFSNEVEEAINEIYLSEWILSEKSNLENKLLALVEMSKIQTKKISVSKTNITNALEKIPEIKKRAFKLKHKSDLLLLELKELEKELKQLAESTVEERRHKAKMYKLLKTASTLLKSSPVGQPYTTAIGIGVDVINQYDYSSNGWDDINSIRGVYDEISSIDWNSHNKSWEQYKREYNNLDKIESLKKVYQDFFKPLENDLADLQKVLTESKMKDSDMQKEFERLKSENETFKALANSIQVLTKERAVLIKDVEHLTSSIYDEFNNVVNCENLLGNLIYSISRKQLILTRSNKNVIEEIKKEAISKLDYYSYLLVRSYEYRFLRDYPNQIYNTDIYKSAKGILKENNYSKLLTNEQIQRLISVYLIDLKKITSQIIFEYNSGLFTKRAKKYIPLSKEQINDLNRIGKTKLNLIKSNFFDLNREKNLRLVDINIMIDKSNFDISPNNIEFGEVDVFINHSGKSKILKDNNSYFYSHYSPKNQSKYSWGARYSIHQEEINQIDISPTDYSILTSILSDFASSNYITIFSRPGLLSEYEIELNKNIINLDSFNLKKLTLEIVYDYD